MYTFHWSLKILFDVEYFLKNHFTIYSFSYYTFEDKNIFSRLRDINIRWKKANELGR